jgi:hypothetical protein
MDIGYPYPKANGGGVVYGRGFATCKCTYMRAYIHKKDDLKGILALSSYKPL